MGWLTEIFTIRKLCGIRVPVLGENGHNIFREKIVLPTICALKLKQVDTTKHH